MERDCVILDGVKAVLPLELMYWEDETVIGSSPNDALSRHVSKMKKTIDL